MDALHAVRQPLVVTFPVPCGLTDAETRRLIDRWYEAIAAYDFVYLGGTSFALNPPCPDAGALRAALRATLGGPVEVEVLSRVLRRMAPERVNAFADAAV